MPLQYISDNEGNHTAVLIPINEWQLIVEKHEDLKKMELSNSQDKVVKPSDFAGKMPSDIADEFHKYIEKSRQDWN
jgi:hypothetical protein